MLACSSMRFSAGALALIYSLLGGWVISAVLAFINPMLISRITLPLSKQKHWLFFAAYFGAGLAVVAVGFAGMQSEAWFIPIFGVPPASISHFVVLVLQRRRKKPSAEAMDLTGGHDFHVFPDGCFVIEAFCDICESEAIASGRWKLQGGELVISDLTERTNQSPPLSGMKWVREQFGSVDKLRLFVTERGESIGETILISDETARKGLHVDWKYIRRIEYYRDWPKEENRLPGK